MEPTTEKGKSFLQILTNLLQKYPGCMGPFQRIVFMYSSKIMNEDEFITSLYGQDVLDKLPLDLIKELGTPDKLLRVQHAIEHCFKNQCSKELIVALEWSGNHEVLTQLLNWAEKEIKSPAVVKLEIEHVNRPAEAKSTEAKEVTVTQLEQGMSSMNVIGTEAAEVQVASHPPATSRRTASWDNCEEVRSILICDDHIILGWEEQIGIYQRQNLACARILKAGSGLLLQCADTDGEKLIACFSDSKIYFWDIKSGQLIQDPLDIPPTGDYWLTFSLCVKYRNAEVVIGDCHGVVSFWKYKNNTLALAQRWLAYPRKTVTNVDFDEHLIVLFIAEKYLIQVWNKNCVLLRQLQSLDFVAMKYCNGRIASGVKDRVLRFWDPDTLECSGSFKCSRGFDMNEKYVATWDDWESLLVWSLEDVFNKEKQAEIVPLLKLKRDEKEFSSQVRLGTDIIVLYGGDRKSVEVFEFE